MAGIAVIIQLVTGKIIPPEMLSGGVDLILQLVTFMTGVAAIILKEKK